MRMIHSKITENSMSEFEELTKKILAFRDERNWAQFHNPKDCSLSLVLEAAEVMEHFQWKSSAEIKEYVVSHKKEIGEELADVLYWVLLLTHDLKIDLVDASEKKLEKNRKKYPVEKARDRHAKYDKL